ncbi:NACHT, LRR and PYD domains-containing protein 3-like [Amphiura filiformis]|uniref:NACHT, LRR and PYD domains-containing protein 3-like n=1 Tax=Amphiura filiformis TaxID=82378 RepID=UPI003B20D40B
MSVVVSQVIQHRKPFGVLSRELKSAGDIVCIERKLGKEETELVKRILVKGVPGAGKSSTISKLAYDWACGRQNSPISKFQLLFALTINEIDTNTDLIGIIQDQLLPEVSGESLRAYIQSNASEVVILLDGYDEASKYFHQCKNISNVLRSKWLAEACVIVTTRSNQVGKFCQNYGPYLQVHIPGFSQFGVKEYIRKFFKLHQEANDYDVSDGVDKKVRKFLLCIRASSLYQLSFIPIILSMLCLLWVDDEKLPSTVTALYKEVITHLAKHTFAKTATDELDVRSVQNWSERVLDHIGNVAIEGLFEDRLVFQSDEFEKAALEDACSLGVVTKEKKSYKLNVTYHVTFLHKTFQEICAAYYWTKLIDTEMETFKKYLMQVTGDNIDEMEYLLRFACGLSVKAAEVILPHVVQIICNDCKWKDTAGYVNFYNNIYLQIPIFLLYETESNNTEIGQCSELYMLLKPLLKSVCLERSDQGVIKSFKKS